MKKLLSIFVICLMFSYVAQAKVVPAAVFGNHMVLQREMAVPVWGTADAGEAIKVTFAGQVLETTADAKGEWMVKLQPLATSVTPQDLTINDIVIKDVLVGEVWLCSGQSNMEMYLHRIVDCDKVYAKIPNPLLRITVMEPYRWEKLPRKDFPMTWQTADVEKAKKFSAIAYVFGQTLQEKLGIPIGLIGSYWGGTRIEPWTPPCGFDGIPELKGIAYSVNSKLPWRPEYKENAEKTAAAFKSWLDKFREAASNGAELLPPPAFPDSLKPADRNQVPTVLYNAMIYPFVPFAFRGAIWYQGCSNRTDDKYFYKMQALFDGWKEVFQNPAMKFYFVQLAPYRYGGDVEALPRIWEAQSAFEKANEPQVGMAVINDLGEYGDIHPRRKIPVAERLSAFALARDYGFENIHPDFPRHTGFKHEGNALVVSFEHVQDWKIAGDTIEGFQIAGVDGLFREAKATMRGTDIVLSHPEIALPHGVRYLWNETVTGKLFNEYGLPLTAFRIEEPIDAETMVKELAGDGWQLAYDLDLFKGVTNDVAQYSVDNSKQLNGKVKRVAYLVRGQKKNGGNIWLLTTMDAFTPEVAKCGVPCFGAQIDFQQKVKNITVGTNCPGVPSGSFPEGNIEFWPNNYGTFQVLKLPGANNQKYDFDDNKATTPVDGYGCMQVHLFSQKTTLFAFNNFNTAHEGTDFGIGNNPNPKGNPDWTFARNLASDWNSASIQIFVMME